MKKWIPLTAFLFTLFSTAAQSRDGGSQFPVRGFHIDLRVQVMKMGALKDFAYKLSQSGINTLVMEWEATYPYESNPIIPNRYAYTKEEIRSFIKYCTGIGIDVIPLQQSFGHVEYILRHERYRSLREDPKDYSQVCPLETSRDSLLFTQLYTELISTHSSKYIHIGGDETYLLGHDEKCRLKAAQVGKSRLYTDYIRMLCNIVIRLGKKPVLWADIALKYPEAIKTLPKGTVFVDWNYGWAMDHFGDHQKLMASGFEIWGAPSIRSSPDNYNLTQWEKHFKNIRDFIPISAKLGYRGMIMTSWSTSGVESSIFESESDVTELYAIRHVYPLSGFNILVAAYLETLQTKQALRIDEFVANYCKDRFGFDRPASTLFWKALTAAPYEIQQGKVQSPTPMSVAQLLDSNRLAVVQLNSLVPVKNQEEYEHYKLMADIRDYYLRYQVIELAVNSPSIDGTRENGVSSGSERLKENGVSSGSEGSRESGVSSGSEGSKEYGVSPSFDGSQKKDVLDSLDRLLSDSKRLDARFRDLNKDFLYPSQIEEENQIRNAKVVLLSDRLLRKR